MKVRKKELDDSIFEMLKRDKEIFYKSMKELEPDMNNNFFYD